MIKHIVLFVSIVSNCYLSIAGRENLAIKDSSIYIKDFGAKGDGISDDYPAFIAAADYINKRGGGTLMLTKGVYFIAPYFTQEKPVADIIFKNCDGLKITGKNAVISVNGNFHRGVDATRKHKFSNSKAICPLHIINSKNVTIDGLEINGNVDKMTRDTGVVEGAGFLIWIQQCDNTVLSNLLLHHAQSDGIYIGGGAQPCRDLRILDCVSRNNARQGLSITFLDDALIKNCQFLNTGITGGQYGYHRPAAGIDIEPNKILPRTGNITIDSCFFENNVGGQFLCTAPKSTFNVTLKNSKLVAKSSTIRYQVILAADSVMVENCDMDLGMGVLFPTWKALPGSKATIKNCTIKSGLQGILSSSNDPTDFVLITNNSLFFTGDSLTSYFPYLQTTNLRFLNNKVFIPSRVIKTKKFQSLVQHAIESQGNLFYSDSPSIKPRVAYDKTKLVKDKQ